LSDFDSLIGQFRKPQPGTFQEVSERVFIGARKSDTEAAEHELPHRTDEVSDVPYGEVSVSFSAPVASSPHLYHLKLFDVISN
jgi:hypothetical protein